MGVAVNFSWKKLSRIDPKPQNSRKFSPSKYGSLVNNSQLVQHAQNRSHQEYIIEREYGTAIYHVYNVSCAKNSNTDL